MSRDKLVRLSDEEYDQLRSVHRLMDGDNWDDTPIGSVVGRLAQDYLAEKQSEGTIYVKMFEDE